MTTTVNSAPIVAAAVETVESHLHPTPSWDVADHPVPTGREEIWRFSPVKKLRKLFSEDAETGSLDWDVALPEGIVVSDLSADEARALAVEAPVDRISAIAAQGPLRRSHIQIPANGVYDEPIVFTAKGDGGLARDHIVLSVGANAQATVVFHFVGAGAYAEKSDFIVGPGAQLNIVTLQDWDDDTVHGGQRSLSVGRDAQVKSVTASLGGGVVRLQENFRYDGPGGELNSYGLYFVDSGQHIQHRLFVDHNEPHTKSNVDYRGALQGKGANAVWIGDVLIRKAAEGIDTYESNKNLLLTEGCKVDSVPNLEIETGEIEGAGHSSSTGRFDELQLFYLRSRGVPEREARRLVVHGFFWDIIRRIGIDSIQEKLLERVEREIAAVESAGAAQ
ncbi:Fe-S cluster assembly protein SufD [Tessaracoccus caeni]|uniref:Fe-S cluster assembly protein SufD n=1 Tax=Tessaracoccus caeni TaxID=3031239 RepID=UPI0023DAA1E0|nr:Fe-S cluster assembly protein SufD [Tessaracoccus caeni]MDF1489508.1 Fe-S cluster assembly protein SufD [Tessaracoccus caeni]